MIEKKNVLVLGGTGSIGSELVSQCLDRGANKVTVFSRDEIKHFMMRQRLNDSRLHTVVGDIRDIRSLGRAFQDKVDIMYHAAAMKHVVMCEQFPIECNQTNVQGTQNVVDAALEHNVPRAIFVSTDKAANPSTVMGASKLQGERIFLNANTDAQVFSCVRFGNVANARGSVIPVWVEALRNGRLIRVSNPEMTRFIMTINESVGMIIKATALAAGNEIFILKMKAFRLGNLVEVFKKKGAHVIQDYAYQYEKMHEELMSETESRCFYDLDDMFAITTDNRGIGLCRATTYNSNSVELLSEVELTQLVDNALNASYG